MLDTEGYKNKYSLPSRTSWSGGKTNKQSYRSDDRIPGGVRCLGVASSPDWAWGMGHGSFLSGGELRKSRRWQGGEKRGLSKKREQHE